MNMFKLTSAVATAGLVATLTATPAFATVEVLGTGNEISGNGAMSYSKIQVVSNTTSLLTQQNQTTVETQATSDSSSGGNQVKGNTGSGSSLTTGPASSETTVAVGGSVNAAFQPDPCGCLTPSTGNLISGNGYKSVNKIKLFNTQTSSVGQVNLFSVGTLAGATSTSGFNKVKYNTGGTSDLGTGGATSTTTVEVQAPQNLLNVGL